jgi:hypothetical protein
MLKNVCSAEVNNVALHEVILKTAAVKQYLASDEEVSQCPI